MEITTLIWDWNGTLINDVDICVDCINVLLEKRQLPLLDLEKYREVFRFPVKEYYEEVGFDFSKEPYDKVAMEFIDIYIARLPEADLHKDVVDTLSEFSRRGLNQSVLSAMEHNNLVKSITEKGIFPYFGLLMGISDHFASGKIENARQIISKLDTDPQHTLLIGDTLHDYEVAQEIGCHCILVAHGHQSMEHLKEAGCPVAIELSDVVRLMDL